MRTYIKQRNNMDKNPRNSVQTNQHGVMADGGGCDDDDDGYFHCCVGCCRYFLIVVFVFDVSSVGNVAWLEIKACN